MRSFMSKIDRFCYKHPNFGIPNLMTFIVLGNLAIWLLSAMDSTGLLLYYLYFSPALVLKGEIWRLITFIFVPESSSAFMLLLFLYFYYFIGRTLESEWGTGRFTIYYLLGIILSVVFAFIVYFISGMSYSISASYINLSMFFAFATLFPDVQVLLFFIIPIKVRWLAIIDALYFAYAIFSMLGAGFGLMSFLPLVAMLNYFIFCGEWLFDLVRPSTIKQRQKTVNYKREAQRAQKEMNNRAYNRKCAVCGRTDTSHPELEFRYCSRCVGYHCFCEEHINKHVHFES